MPYEGEFAQYRSIKRIAESERIKTLLERCEIRDQSSNQAAPPTVLRDPVSSDWTPAYVIGIDGSGQEIPMRTGFPGAEASYVTVASVMLNMNKLQELDAVRPVNPAEFRRIEEADSIDAAFPGSNVVLENEVSAESSLRRVLFEVLADQRMSDDGESLLDTYEALLAFKSGGERQNCPYEDCQKADRLYERGLGEYQCPCSLRRALYSTDALRIHEGMAPGGTNGAMFAEIRQVLERLWTVHILRTIEQHGWLSSLTRLAIVLDGPLAVFGHPAWLSEAIYRELSRINQAADHVNEEDILLMGIEKSGFFADHFNDLDVSPEGTPDRLSRRTTFLLNDEYIKKNIIFSESERPYGFQTYFGRKFFYKSASGARIVGSLPFYHENHRDLSTAYPVQYPRIYDALHVLDRLASTRYPNALIPLVSAHAEAAIPMNIGRRVLERLARELVGDRQQ